MKKKYFKPAVGRTLLSGSLSLLEDSGIRIGDLGNKNNDGSSTSDTGFGTDHPTFGGAGSFHPAKQHELWDDGEN